MRTMVQWMQCLIIGVVLVMSGLGAQENEMPPQEQPVTQEVAPQETSDTQVPLQQEQQPAPAPQAEAAATPAPVQEAPIVPAVEQPATPEAVPVPQAVVQPPLGPDEVRGIDTVDIKDEDAQGNWLYKRIWYDRALRLYGKIREAVNKIFEMRIGFFAKRAELDKNVLDPFYIKIGLSQGELQEILAELIEKSGKKANAADVVDQAEDQKSELEQLQKEVQLVVKQDSEVEDAILMLVEQLNKVRRFEHEAWINFKSIAQVLDDRKARELFYKVDNAWRNIQEMQGYIENTFSNSFDILIERIKEKISTIDTAILALKEKGIDLKKQVAEDQEQEEQQEAPKGFFTRYIIDPIKRFFQAIWSVIRWPLDKIMGKKVVEEEDEEVEVEAVEEEVTPPQKPVAQKAVPVSSPTPAQGIAVTKEEVEEMPQQEEVAEEAPAEDVPADLAQDES